MGVADYAWRRRQDATAWTGPAHVGFAAGHARCVRLDVAGLRRRVGLPGMPVAVLHHFARRSTFDLSKEATLMAEKTPEPVVLPDVATEPHPTGHEEELQHAPREDREAERTDGDRPATGE
jgi:hypothetical protein